MLRTVTRVYVDTSVLGGVFDDEFADESKAFFEAADKGRFHIVLSGKYNAVNVLNGYPPIAIHSPLEVIPDED